MPDGQTVSGSKARRRRDLSLRIGILVLLGAASVLVLYFAAAHRLLATGLLRSLVNSSPQSTWIDYDAATTPWPGHLRVENLRIRGRDSNVQWFLRLDEARVVFSLGDLLARKFHVLRATGSGLSFRLRKIRKPEDPSPAPVSLIPPIPGFPDPPLPSSTPVPPAPTGWKPWAVEVENLAVDRVDEIWIEVYRSRGRARLTGGFFLRPQLEAAVGPAAIDFLSGDVRIGAEPILVSRMGRIECRIERYDPRRVTGDAVWEKTSGSVALGGRVETLRFLNYFLRHSPEPRLSGGSGRLQIEASVHRGIARGQARLAARGIEARTGRDALHGGAAVTLRIAHWDLESGPLDLAGSRVELSDVASAAAGSRDWWGRFDLVAGRLGRELTVHVEAKCRDARPLYPLFGTSLPKWTRGLLELEGLAASADVTLGPSLVRVRGLEAKGGSFHIEGEYRKSGGAKDGVFLIDAGKINVGVATRNGKASLRLLGARRWFEKIRDAGLPASDWRDHRDRSTTTAVP